MFRFFRKIREEILVTKKSRKYISYAVGEFILVVLGILIALQINNWNEERIEQRQIADYAQSLINDLERDLAMAAVIKTEIDVLLEQIKSSGALPQMRNQDLAEKISAYEAFTHHLEGDFDFDRAVTMASGLEPTPK
jgi:hypothetical protein